MRIGNLTIQLNRPLSVGWNHGEKADPSKWGKWRRFYITAMRLPTVKMPSTGYRIWFYTRQKAYDLDFYFDRRKPV